MPKPDELIDIAIYELQALADLLGTSYGTVRNSANKYNKGLIEDYRGYHFFGIPGVAWFGYKPVPGVQLSIHIKQAE